MTLVYPFCGESDIKFSIFYDNFIHNRHIDEYNRFSMIDHFDDKLVFDTNTVVFKNSNKYDDFMESNKFVNCHINYENANIKLNENGHIIYSDINQDNIDEHYTLANHLHESIECYVNQYDNNLSSYASYVFQYLKSFNESSSSSEDSSSGSTKAILSAIVIGLAAIIIY